MQLVFILPVREKTILSRTWLLISTSPSKNNRSVLNFWGIGGASKEDYSEVEDPAEWSEYDDYAIYDFRTIWELLVSGMSCKLVKKDY
jgi:hypothetical protein